ncbi:hypothetical protein CMO88_03925 [Candidatus Woesearchaeota archaeon]|nr:hypothetical protein [Candidatus Woesearchaeota archaeon]|tara:strand:+ start:842 stop:1726 length:885 start_codon:yes stop_codon:yes gene_type:complete
MPSGITSNVSFETGTLPNGSVVELAVKTRMPLRPSLRELSADAFKAEAGFLAKTTRAGVVGVPKLYSTGSPENQYSPIRMEKVEGYEFNNVDDSAFRIKSRALYVRTMANIMAHTSMVKPDDHKGADIRVIDPSLESIGGLIILDFGTVKPVTDDSVRRFLLYEGVPLHLHSIYNVNKNLDGELHRGRLGSRQDVTNLLIGDHQKALGTLATGIVEGSYTHDLSMYVQDLIAFYKESDTSPMIASRDLPDDEERAKREHVYNEVLAWTKPSEWLKDGIDIEASKPWIANLEDRI